VFFATNCLGPQTAGEAQRFSCFSRSVSFLPFARGNLRVHSRAVCFCHVTRAPGVPRAARADSQVLTAPRSEALRDLQLNAALALLCESNPQGSFVDEDHLLRTLPLPDRPGASGPDPSVSASVSSSAAAAAAAAAAARQRVVQMCRHRQRAFAELGRKGLAVKRVAAEGEDEESVVLRGAAPDGVAR
jgi:hypothetical protein